MTFTFLVCYRFLQANKNNARREYSEGEMRIYRWSLRESDVLKIAPFLRWWLHGTSSYNYNHPPSHLWFSETYMKGRRNNRLSGNRNSPFVERLQHTRKLDKHIDHHFHSIAKFKHISSGRGLAYCAPNELLCLMLCQKWEREWALTIRDID